jgi:hypothetical protein
MCFAGILVLGQCIITGEAWADVPPFRPLTHWIPNQYSPSGVAIVLAGLALSAAIVSAGLIVARRPATRSKRLTLSIAAAGVLLVAALTAEVYWEQIVNRYRGPNRPEFNALPSPAIPESSVN